VITEGLQAVIYGVATSLLYPVLALLVLGLLLVAFEAGRLTFESFVRVRARRGVDVETLRQGVTPDGSSLVAVLDALGPTLVTARVKDSLGDGSDLGRSRLLKALTDGEAEANRRLERTRVLVRLGPLLGLMGTLIPISPALVALARGDVLTLSNNLVIAFSTTVVGLLIGAVAYVVSTVRERHYREDVSRIEYIFDRVVV
jgi:biopolymer transport protein ExbB/TolQ